MIFTLIGGVVVGVLNSLFSLLGHVSTLPLGMDPVVQTAFGAFFGFMAIFWPLQIVWTCFKTYIGIQFALKVLRLLRVIR